jgi:tetratricopeptide (TPR) repeat protein/DNA-binding XRE family transcriptional regulator
MLGSKVSMFGVIAGLARKVAGWSGEEMARRTGCTVKTVSRHENAAEGEEPSYEALCERMRVLGLPEETVDVLASGLEPAFRPLAPPGVSWWLTLEDRARLRKVAALSGAAWGREAENWLVASVERALEESDRREAAGLGAELRRLPAAERRVRVEADPRFHSWAVCVLLCDWSERAAATKPAWALAWAELAVEVAKRVPGEKARRSRLLGYATAFLANALRVDGMLREADRAFAEVWRLWEQGAESADGPLPLWCLLDLEASLRRDRREFETSLALLAQALECAPQEVVGRIRVKQGSTLEQKGDVEAAIVALQAAQPWMDAAGEPRLQYCLWFNLATCFCHLENWPRAEALLADVRALAFECNLDLGFDWLRIRWLGAKVAIGKGQWRCAIQELEIVRQEFIAHGNEYEAALASLELAVLYLEAGRTKDVQELARRLAPSFANLGVLREALASFRVFHQAVEQEVASAELVRGILNRLAEVQGLPSSSCLASPRGIQDESLEPRGEERSTPRGRSRSTEAARIQTTPFVQVGSGASLGRQATTTRIESAAGVEVGSGGIRRQTAPAWVEGASGVQGYRGEEADEQAPGTPGRRRAGGAAGGEGVGGQQDQPQGECRQSAATGRSRHRKAPFEAATPEPARPAGTPPADRLPQDGKKSTSDAGWLDDPQDPSLSEPALLARWLRGIPACTQEALGQLTGLDESALCRHETGKVVPKRRTVERLAAGLGLPFALVETGLRPLARTVVALLKGHGPWKTLSVQSSSVELAERHAELLQASLTALMIERGIHTPEPTAATPWWREPAAPEEIEQLFGELASLSGAERPAALETKKAIQTWSLCPRLCDESERAASSDPAGALNWVEIALRIAELVPGPAEWHLRLSGYCGVFRSNALRVRADDLEAAREEFDRSFRRWQESEVVDPEGLLPEWRLLDLEASLLRDRRQFEPALQRLSRALSLSPPSANGRILVKTASTLEQMGRDGDAIAALREAEPHVDGDRDPHLRCCLAFNLAVSLCHSNRPQEAQDLLPQIELLAERADKAIDRIRIEWLRAQIDTGLENREEARGGLERVRQAFLERRMPYEVALVTLELAVLLLDEGKTAEVQELAGPMIEAFAAQRVRRETLAAVEVFCQAVRADAATAELARSLRAYLRLLGGC